MRVWEATNDFFAKSCHSKAHSTLVENILITILSHVSKKATVNKAGLGREVETHGDHEGDVLVVAAEYLQLGAGGR